MSHVKKHKLVTDIGICIFAGILLQLPGQNRMQTLPLIVSEEKTEEVVIDLSMADLPLRDASLEPTISAKAGLVVDVDSGVILFEKNPDTRLMPASTTKLMTALVAFDLYRLDEVITVKNEQFSIGSKSDLIAGEKITVENTLKALLIGSGNDAALALAQHDPKGYNHFIDEMNKKAEQLHMENSHFVNVSGVEQENHFVSARDLVTLTKQALQNPFIKKIVGTKQETISSIDGTISHQLENTNELLGKVEGLDGVKTGWTTQAGECLVTHTQRQGRRVITVVLGSQDRFKESEELITWVFNHYTWQQFPKEIIQPLPVPKLDQLPVQLP